MLSGLFSFLGAALFSSLGRSKKRALRRKIEREKTKNTTMADLTSLPDLPDIPPPLRHQRQRIFA
jgi:hypothetical protein